ncbi:MAG: hypothetical protein LKF79_01905 [Solobacterium sp.]|nr:hypothetical protein [Solobacterium sp.]MCH4222280.1 hypothetical protein [Solobacterium sp.]MCH4265383.1 hypothetical protein [Solobacterium sp.]
MNLSTALILLGILILMVLAVRYTMKHGSCEHCSGNCSHHEQGCSLYERYRKDHPDPVHEQY